MDTSSQFEAEIRATLESGLAAMNAGDAKGLAETLSQRSDTVHIGTDPDEWMTTAEWVKGVDPNATGDITAVVDDIAVHVESDTVAWVTGRGCFCATDGRERPVRVSAVLVREDGGWRSVHTHASIGLANADMFN